MGDGRCGFGPAQDLDRPRLGRVPPDVTELHQAGEVAVDRRRRGQPERFADLPYRRRIAALGDGGADVVEHLLLTGTQVARFGVAAHGAVLSSVDRIVLVRTSRSKHLFDLTVEHLFAYYTEQTFGCQGLSSRYRPAGSAWPAERKICRSRPVRCTQDDQEHLMTATAPAFGTDHRFVRPVPRHRSAARRSRYLLPPRLLALLAATAVIWITMTAVQADQPPALETYAVSSGDTLWGIAAGVASEGSDVRQTIALIMDLNDLSGSTIHPGQTLVLPAGP
jgi:hypothetical protein